MKKLLTNKTLEIDTPNCWEVCLFLTEKQGGDYSVLMQAWHWFENSWHYQHEYFLFEYQSTATGFIADCSPQTATDWIREFMFYLPNSN